MTHATLNFCLNPMDDGAFGALSLAEFVADARVLVPSRRSRPDRILVPSRVHRSNASTASEETNPRIVIVIVVDDVPLPTVVVVSARVVERIVRLERIVRARNGLARIPTSLATRISSRARRDGTRPRLPRSLSRASVSSRDDVCGDERTNERARERGRHLSTTIMSTCARAMRVTRARASTTRRTTSSRASSRAPRASSSEEAPVHVCEYETFDLGVTLKGTHFIDLTERIDGMIARAGVREGTVHVISRHTTTAVTINEMEDRLVDDARMFFHELAPPGKFYLHNDLDRRHGPPDWPGGDEAWRAQEPENCHSHLLSMLIGNSESIPVSGGKTTLGTWQSCMFVELDGPRPRTVGIQVVGIK
tara:strand:- start:61 stop:1152 length:1092 start_codon:yes stop_codon:yes gene_type:complete